MKRAMQQDGGLCFFCLGCDCYHTVSVKGERPGPSWGWNGSEKLPTITPSVLVRTGRELDPEFVREDGDPPERCHSYVTDGRIQYLDDCTHHLAGQTIALPSVYSDVRAREAQAA